MATTPLAEFLAVAEAPLQEIRALDSRINVLENANANLQLENDSLKKTKEEDDLMAERVIGALNARVESLREENDRLRASEIPDDEERAKFREWLRRQSEQGLEYLALKDVEVKINYIRNSNAATKDALLLQRLLEAQSAKVSLAPSSGFSFINEPTVGYEGGELLEAGVAVVEIIKANQIHGSPTIESKDPAFLSGAKVAVYLD